ncbi:MAG: alginate lyase family protein [Pirellulales bacterium]|nr:alginate lyase family protein [Pirellulales bacterium]
MLAPGLFRFQNQTFQVHHFHPLRASPVSPAERALPSTNLFVQPATPDHLWRYHLHYFDDLNAVGGADRNDWHLQWLADWISACPPGTPDAWDPYPTSLRIVNWIKWAYGGGSLSPALTDSLAAQARWLAQSLEYHLLGNHLLANAKALVFAGAYFSGPEADQWLLTGMQIYAQQLPEQILPDGGHFELSPMYQAIILEDLLDIWNLAHTYQATCPNLWAAVNDWKLPVSINRMQLWLAMMTHPDGEIAFFNDATGGQATRPGRLSEYALRLKLPAVPDLPEGCTPLPASGYLRWQTGPLVMLMDVAAIGPDYLPGHAHADTLSCELSLYGQRCLVNSGISVYGTSAERLRQRGTASHNTVMVDSQDSSEVWGGFRVARRARVTQSEWKCPTISEFYCKAAHDGYQRLSGRVTHTRRWDCTPEKLCVTDELTGNWESAVIIWHLHPAFRLVAGDTTTEAVDTGQLLQFASDRVRVTLAIHGTAEQPRVQNCTWHPEFGLSVPNLRLEIPFSITLGSATHEITQVFTWRELK